MPYTGSTFGLPDTSNGLLHRLCSLHYYQGGVKPPGATVAQGLANAQALAAIADIIVGNVIENPATAAITTDKFQGHTAAMLAINPDLVMMPYNKSAEIDEGVSYYPNNYYAHKCPWPTGAKINVYSAAVYIAQPSTAAGQSAFVDPRGWTAHSFKEQRSRDAWARVTRYNTLHGADQLKGAYLDSMNVFNALICNPATGVAYGNAGKQSFIDRVWAIGDEAQSLRPDASYPVFGNGMGNGPYYASNGHLLIDHLDGGLAEFWLWPDYSPATTYYTEAKWRQCIDMVYDMNIAKGKVAMLVCNLNNTVAIGGTPSPYTAAQKEQRRRYAAASYYMAKQDSTFFEFVDTTAVSPWDEDHPYYHLDLGVPIDNPGVSVSSLHHAPLGGETVGWYQRNYTTGATFVNPTPTATHVQMDRDYQDAITGTAHASGSLVAMAANTGLILITPGGAPPSTNPGPASITITSPPATVTSRGQTIAATITHPDGIASAQARVVGVTGWSTMTPIGGDAYELSVTLAGTAGVSVPNTVQVRATDMNPAPLTQVASEVVTVNVPFRKRRRHTRG